MKARKGGSDSEEEKYQVNLGMMPQINGQEMIRVKEMQTNKAPRNQAHRTATRTYRSTPAEEASAASG